MSDMSPHGLDRAAVERWVALYVELWRTEGTERLVELFTEDATYLTSPWREPIGGLEAIATFWEAGRDGSDEVFTMASQTVAVEGNTAVVRVEVDYERGSRWRDLWVLRFATDGRVIAFEEWPFAPERHDGH